MSNDAEIDKILENVDHEWIPTGAVVINTKDAQNVITEIGVILRSSYKGDTIDAPAKIPLKSMNPTSKDADFVEYEDLTKEKMLELLFVGMSHAYGETYKRKMMYMNALELKKRNPDDVLSKPVAKSLPYDKSADDSTEVIEE